MITLKDVDLNKVDISKWTGVIWKGEELILQSRSKGLGLYSRAEPLDLLAYLKSDNWLFTAKGTEKELRDLFSITQKINEFILDDVAQEMVPAQFLKHLLDNPGEHKAIWCDRPRVFKYDPGKGEFLFSNGGGDWGLLSSFGRRPFKVYT